LPDAYKRTFQLASRQERCSSGRYFSSDAIKTTSSRPASRNLQMRSKGQGRQQYFMQRCQLSGSAASAYQAAPELDSKEYGLKAYKAVWGNNSHNCKESKDGTQLVQLGDTPELLFSPGCSAPREQLSLLGSGVFCEDGRDAVVLHAMMRHALSCVRVMDPLDAELQDL
jgi:hypothetical protein